MLCFVCKNLAQILVMYNNIDLKILYNCIKLYIFVYIMC